MRLVPVTDLREQFLLLINWEELSTPFTILHNEAVFAIASEMHDWRYSQSDTEGKS